MFMRLIPSRLVGLCSQLCIIPAYRGRETVIFSSTLFLLFFSISDRGETGGFGRCHLSVSL